MGTCYKKDLENPVRKKIKIQNHKNSIKLTASRDDQQAANHQPTAGEEEEEIDV